jgi:hypothetical protein
LGWILLFHSFQVWANHLSRFSADENDLPETTGPDSISYTFKAANSVTTTPKSAWFLCKIVKSPISKQPALAASIDAYLRGVFCCGRFNPIFYHFLPSEEDPEIFLSLQGWPSEEEGRAYWDVSLL